MAPDTVGLPDADVFGPAPVPAGAPPGGLSDAAVFGAPPPQSSAPPLFTGEQYDNYFAESGAGKILDAFGQGAAQGWGSQPMVTPPTAEEALPTSITHDLDKSAGTLAKTAHDVIIRPAAMALYSAARAVAAPVDIAAQVVARSLSAAGGAIVGAAEAVGPKTGATVESGLEAATDPGLAESLMGMGPAGAVAGAAAALARSPLQGLLDTARSLRVIGPDGEAGWQGIAPETSAMEAARRSLAPSQEAAIPEEAPQASVRTAPEALEAAPETAPPQPPDIHAVARQIAPDVFGGADGYDALAQRKATFAQWIDQLAESRDQQVAAPIDAQIADAQARIQDAQARNLSRASLERYQGRLEDLQDQRQQALAEANQDTPGMARVRRALMATDFKMRDLAPDVTTAYQEAAQRTGTPEVPPAPVEAPPAAPAFQAPVETRTGEGSSGMAAAQAAEQLPSAQAASAAAAPEVRPVPVDIAGNVSQKLVAAGRPQEEADAAAAIVQAHYETRAQRLGTTAEELYAKETPNIEAGARGRKGEMGRTILKDGQSTVRLMANADASTFMHETGHQWLDELTRDAADPRADEGVKADAQTVRDWLGVKEGEPIARGQHEKFARGFERYLMEGRAPSQALAGVFAKFKGWLTQIYQTVSRLRSPISDDIRGVFDRMISAPDRGTIIAPEREADLSIGDRHKAIADKLIADAIAKVEGINAGHLRIEGGQIRTEADEFADLRGIESGGGGDEPPGGPLHGNGDEGRPGPGQARGREAVGAVGESGAADTAYGRGVAGSRGRSQEITAPPAGASQSFAPAEERLIDKAGNIRLDNLNTPEDVSEVIRDAADFSGGFVGARRGVISDAQVLDLADALGMDASDLDKRKLGQAFNAEQVVAARKLLIQSATNVRDLAARAATGSDADVMAYAEAADRHLMIQSQVSGVTAEAGRALRAFRQLEGMKEAQGLSTVLQEATGRTLFQMRMQAKKIAQLETPAQISKVGRDLAKPGLFDWIQSAWTNGLLSGPLTHATYTAAGQFYALFRSVGESGFAAAVGAARRVSGIGPADYADVREVAAQLYGQMRGARNGAKAAWAAAKSGGVVLPQEVADLAKREAAMSAKQLAAISNPLSRSVGQAMGMHGVIPGKIGKVLESPFRMVAALHSFNWTTFYSQSISLQAAQVAMKEGLSDNVLVQRIASLTMSPTDDMIRQASDDAGMGALMQRPSYDSLMGKVSRLTNLGVKVPDIGKLPMGTLRPLKYVDPFVQIQGNILRTAFMRGTPLALFKQSVRDDLSFKNGGAAFDRTAGKLLAGTGFMVAAGGLAAQGILNWSGPSAPNQARAWRRIYGMPHGLTIGNLSYNVLRLGNLGMQMSVAADLYHVASQIGSDSATHVAADLVHAFSQNFLDESFLRGPSQLMQAIEDSDRYGPSYVRSLVSSFLPFSVGLSQVAHEVDPESRQARTTMDAFMAKLPVASEELLPRRDVWGEPVPSEGWMGTYREPIQGDAVDRALFKIGIYPSIPERRIRGVPLTDQQYDDYSRIAGRSAHMQIERMVASPGFSQMPAVAQHDMVQKAVTWSRKMAADNVMMSAVGGDNDIMAKANAAKLAQLGPQGAH